MVNVGAIGTGGRISRTGILSHVFTCSLLLAVLCTLLLSITADALYAAVGMWAFVIVFYPCVQKSHYDIFSPWSFVILSVVIGTTLRGLYISLGLPDAETVDSLFLLGESPEYFFYPSIVLLTGLLALTAGYLLIQPPKAVVTYRNIWLPQRVWFFCACAVVMSLVATYYYVLNTGGFESHSISAKRTTISDIELQGDSDYRGYGLLRTTGKIALFAHLIMLANLASDKKNGYSLKRLFAWLLLVVACLLPFYNSNRSDVVMAIILSIAVSYYMNPSFKVRKLIVAGVCLVVVIHVMTIFRRGEHYYDTEASPFEIFHHVIANRNNLGVSKTAHIIQAVPSQLEVKWGETIYVWLVAPIPREIWPEKPVIHSGPLIGHYIYGNRVSGVPPGIVAELYWNFLWPGVLVGCLLLGGALRCSYEWLVPARGHTPHGVLLYVVGPMAMGSMVIGASLGAGLFNMCLDMVLMKLGLMFVMKRGAVSQSKQLIETKTYGRLKVPGKAAYQN